MDVNLPTGYDPAARLCGAVRVEVSTLAELEANLARGRTAFVLLMADRYDPAPTWLTLEQVAPLAEAAGVPIIVDAAADYPTVPNPYLSQGADLVAYSGGKILRGPQGGHLHLILTSSSPNPHLILIIITDSPNPRHHHLIIIIIT